MAKRPTGKAHASSAATLTPEVIDVTPDPPELALAKTDGSSLASFVAGLKVFFTRANDLELVAKSRLVEARALQLPTSQEEDEQLKNFVRLVSAENKTVEEHWQVTTMLSRFHKRLTAKRAIATGANDEAIRIGTNLHTRYADEEKRRAREEEERQRREAEQKERERIAREAAELEEKANAAEAASSDLSQREVAFVDEFVRNGGNATRAAHYAGYKNAEAQGATLITREKIVAAVKAKRDAEDLRRQATAQRQAPVSVNVEPVRPQVAAGKDRETWSGEVLDERAFIEAVVGGRHGIPLDVLTVNPTKLNEYARSLQTVIDRWPGVRAKRTTGIR